MSNLKMILAGLIFDQSISLQKITATGLAKKDTAKKGKKEGRTLLLLDIPLTKKKRAKVAS